MSQDLTASPNQIRPSSSTDAFEVFDSDHMSRGVQCSRLAEDLVASNAKREAEVRSLKQKLVSAEEELKQYRGQHFQLNLAEFYAGKHILITGATGYVGTLVLEKILRIAPNVAQIYILVRSKRGKTPEERLSDYFECAAFSLLKRYFTHRLFSLTQYSNLGEYFMGFMESKITLVAGDISEHNFGIDEDNLSLLNRELNIIIHSAASVSFSNPLDEAIALNYTPVLRLIRMARDCTALIALVHVSSAYVNVHRPHASTVLEKVYPCGIDRDRAMGVVGRVNKDVCTSYGERLMAKFNYPNTYTMTKHWGELAFEEIPLDIPVAIVRPSIICPVLRDPVKGYVGNRSGLSGAILGVGTGYLDFLPGKSDIRLDIIPGDLVANAICAAGASTVKQTAKLSVYHVCSAASHPFDLTALSDEIMKYFHQNPLSPELTFAPPAAHILGHVKARWVYRLRRFKIFMYKLLLTVKGNMTDKMSKRMDKAPSLLREFMGLEAFTSRGWDFDVNNTQHLMQTMNDEERVAMPLLPTDIDWREYLWLTCEGAVQFLLPAGVRKSRVVSVVKQGANAAKYIYTTLGSVVVIVLIAILLYFFMIKQ